MSGAYPETGSPSLLYFDYGAHTLVFDFQSDLDELCATVPALSSDKAGRSFRVRSVRAAYLEGYRVAFSAASREGPRIGLLNLLPQLPPQLYTLDGAASPVQCAMQQAEELEARLSFVNPTGRVYGVLYELPCESEAALLELIGREGSFNRFARLPCTVVATATPTPTTDKTQVTPGQKEAAAMTETAIACAAIDMDVLTRRYVVEPALESAWQPLPPLLDAAEAKARDARTCGSGRWPYLHWCNCILSNRLAPSPDYLQSLSEMLEASPVAQALPPGVDTVAALLGTFYGLSQDEKTSPSSSTSHAMCVIPTRDIARSEKEQRTWYLAYGSNLSWEQVCLRIGPPYDRRPAKLHDYELIANKTPYSPQYASFGYYNVEPSAERRRKEAEGLSTHGKAASTTTMPGYVCGAAYEISQAQLEMMDGFEGGYRREFLPCEDMTESEAERISDLACWTYIAETTSKDLLPSKEYLERVLEGADILPAEYIAGIRSTPTNPLRSPRQDRRLRKEL